MNIRFHLDEDGEPHIHSHNVGEREVIEALRRPLERITGRDDSFIAIGRTVAGRVLKIIYCDARDGDGIFVVTAYDLSDKQRRALGASSETTEKIMKKNTSTRRTAKAKLDTNRYPKGWDRKRVEALTDYYDHQTDDEAIAEAEAAYAAVKTTMMQVPVELVPQVEKLIARRAKLNHQHFFLE